MTVSAARIAFRSFGASAASSRSGARVRLHKSDPSVAANGFLKQGAERIRSGDDVGAEGFFSEAAAILGNSLPDSPVQRDLHSCMGNLAMHRGDFEAGERHLELAWDVAQRVSRSGMGHDSYIDTAGVACDLAASKVHLGAYEEADKFLRRGLFHLERAYRPNRPCVVASLLNRAEILSIQGNRANALELLQRAVDLLAGESQQDVVDFGGTPLRVLLRLSLSRSFRIDGDVKRSAKILECLVRDDLPAVAAYRLQSQMSLALVAQGDMQAAAEAQRVCLSDIRSVWGTRKHPDVAIATSNFALFADTTDQAVDMYETAIDMVGSQHLEFKHNLLTAKGERRGIDSASSHPLREKVDVGEGRVFWQLNHFNLACGVSTLQLL